MTQGDFTKEEANEMLTVLRELFDAIPKKKQPEYIGHLNELALFLESAKRAAPDKTELK
jgi:hypothetical protein